MKQNNFNNKNIIPERLIQAREARGMTKTELAEKLDITRQAIYHYENGKRNPQPDILNQIINILNFPYSFFIKPIDKTVSNSSGMLFRALKSSTKKEIKQIETRSIWLKEIYAFLKNYVDFPDLNIPDFNYKHDYTMEDIEIIAKKIRNEWGLGKGPINDLIYVLEKNGVIVNRLDIKDDYDLKIDACVEEIDDRPFIVLINNNTSSVRLRFSLAHELAHILLHMGIDDDLFDSKKAREIVEKEAHRFAAALLLPKESMVNEVMSTSIEHLKILKKRWKVSIQAIAYRCKELGIFTETQHINIRKRLARKKMITNEPLDDIIPLEEPSFFKQSIEILLENNIISKNEIINEISLNNKEIENLCNLSEGFLRAKDNVISLNFKNK